MVFMMVYWWEEIDCVCGEDRGRLSSVPGPGYLGYGHTETSSAASSRGEAHIVIHTLHHTTLGVLKLWMDELVNMNIKQYTEFMAYCQF